MSDPSLLWPLQSECDAFYGNPRGIGDEPSARWEADNIVRIRAPWVMTYEGAPISSIRVHKRCSEALTRVFGRIWDAAGRDQATVIAWGASLYGGAYNFRCMRGSSRLSMHSWGCAIDLDPDRNAFHDLKPRFGRAPQSAVVAAFEAEGAVWGGRWSGRSRDGMHFQFARVG